MLMLKLASVVFSLGGVNGEKWLELFVDINPVVGFQRLNCAK